MLASELYAISQNDKCSGPFECYWCGAPCTSQERHDDPPRLPFQRINHLCSRPASPFLCRGCWLWRRKRITINFLGGGLRDIQCPQKHSWLVTPEGSWTLEPNDNPALYRFLLQPVPVFFLSLIVNGPVLSGILPKEGVLNHIQQAVVNELVSVDSQTPLLFTINGTPLTYTPEELERALRNKSGNGYRPGVLTLLKLLGPFQLPPDDSQQGKGRPKKDRSHVDRAVKHYQQEG